METQTVMWQDFGDIELEAVAFADPDPDISYLEQEGFEAERAAYQKGEFSFIAIRAEAEITVNGVVQIITSGGLYGIESHSNQEHLDSIAREEIDALRSILIALGVTLRDESLKGKVTP